MATTITPLGVSALSLLCERDMHPYEMYQLLISRAEDRVVKVRPGSLYHAVDRLQAAGYVRATGTERDGNRPERTTYAITDTGRTALDERLTQMLRIPADEYPAFPLAVSQAHNLSADTVVQLLTARLARLEAQREFFRSGRTLIEHRNVPRRYWLDLTYQHAMVDAQIAWVRQLVTEIESGQLDWQEQTPDAAPGAGAASTRKTTSVSPAGSPTENGES